MTIPAQITSFQMESPAQEPRFAIGVAMSGGGYRAAAYHLGTLSYLQQIGMLPHLEAISTVSGGTFTGTRYLLSLVEKQSFEDYFQEFYTFLLNVDLLELAVEKLGRDRNSNGLPRQLAIDAFAQVYAETLLKKKDGSVFLMKDILDQQFPLTDIIFNSTDFRRGLGFRFQKSLQPSMFGNRFDFLTEEQAANLRVADILAASSCFPGGFEPISWPQSFRGLPEEPLDKQLAMMDGGIYDNQGIESLLLADRRTRRDVKEEGTSVAELAKSADRFQMLIISDTDRIDDNLYTFPPPPPKTLLGSLSIGTLWWFFWIVIVLCGIASIGNALEIYSLLTDSKSFSWLALSSHVTSLILAVLVVWFGLSLWNLLFNKLAPQIPHWERIRDDLNYLVLSQALTMVQLRISSLFVLANNIFMKRIRALLYDQIYADATLKATAVTSMIYKLRKFAQQKSVAETIQFATTHTPDWPFPERPEIARPSKKLLDIVDAAVQMPTTLWFDDSQKATLPKLVATGHATLCFQLMSHMYWTIGPDPSKYSPTQKQLWDRLLQDWTRFQTDPYAMVRSLAPAALQKSIPQ